MLACLWHFTWLFLKSCIDLGQAGFEITLGCFRPHRQQLLVVFGLNALVVALWNIVQLTLILVMIQCDDLQSSKSANDSNCLVIFQSSAEVNYSQGKNAIRTLSQM